MARFLSDEWFEAVNRAEVPVEGELVIEQRVSGTPGGDIAYRVEVGGGRLHLRRGSSDEPAPDVVITMAYDTAVALASGTMTAHDAILRGAIRVSGNAATLSPLASAGGGWAAALTAVRATTSF
jgi:alkyl sulfatase BDS1-like metallo-beta-lactamase superfamily hydrolase